MRNAGIVLIIAVVAAAGVHYLSKQSPETLALSTYTDAAYGYTFSYPKDYTLKQDYQYLEMDPEKEVRGVSVTVPQAIADSTNLGSDTYVSVETMPDVATCSASAFFSEPTSPESITENGTQYSVARTSGAGAGNRYEETVYAFPKSSPCTAVRYFVHYSVFENYPAGTIKEFDRDELIAQFDTIRRSLTLKR